MSRGKCLKCNRRKNGYDRSRVCWRCQRLEVPQVRKPDPPKSRKVPSDARIREALRLLPAVGTGPTNAPPCSSVKLATLIARREQCERERRSLFLRGDATGMEDAP